MNKNFKGCNRHFKQQFFMKGFSLKWCNWADPEENSLNITRRLQDDEQ